MRILVNGEATELVDGATVQAAVEALDLPASGRGALDGLIWATGHYRNGILLAPVTAELVAGVLAGEAPPDWARPADPARFAGVPA